MTKSQLFNKYHGKQIIAAFVVVVATITWQVVNEERLANKNTGTVMGETTVNSAEIEQDKNNQLIVGYQAGLKRELTDYLAKRVNLENNKAEWLEAIGTTKNNILALSVPNEYKDLQVRVVTTLDLEQAALSQADKDKQNTAENHWAEILKQYFWLNQ